MVNIVPADYELLSFSVFLFHREGACSMGRIMAAALFLVLAGCSAKEVVLQTQDRFQEQVREVIPDYDLRNVSGYSEYKISDRYLIYTPDQGLLGSGPAQFIQYFLILADGQSIQPTRLYFESAEYNKEWAVDFPGCSAEMCRDLARNTDKLDYEHLPDPGANGVHPLLQNRSSSTIHEASVSGITYRATLYVMQDPDGRVMSYSIQTYRQPLTRLERLLASMSGSENSFIMPVYGYVHDVSIGLIYEGDKPLRDGWGAMSHLYRGTRNPVRWHYEVDSLVSALIYWLD